MWWPGLIAAASAAPQFFLSEDFENPAALSRWSGKATLEKGFQSEKALSLTSGVVSRRLDAEVLRGCTVRISLMSRAEKVSPKPKPWNGIKCMVIIESPDGKDYPQAPFDTGSFEWQPAALRVRIPENATNLTLVLGLEQVTGKVLFDDVKISVVRPRQTEAIKPIAGPRFKGHNLPRLRGAMISPNLNPEGLRVLGAEWKANLVRFQLIRFGRPGTASAMDNYSEWLEGELGKLDRLLPECRKHGVLVVVDLHSPPGGKGTVSGYVGSDGGLFASRQAQEKFIEVWRQIARRYRSEPAIWGYDLANEPVEDDVADDCEDWQALAEHAARAIREIDPARAIIIEPANWGGPEALRNFQPIPVSNIVYSVHMYLPHAFTHQGVHEQGPALKYPGTIQGKFWDKKQLEQAPPAGR